jgi:transcriptional adapter 2-alpha
MKFRLIDIYNQKLSERVRRKEFVVSRGLLDLQEQTRLDRTRTREEKDIRNMLKVFARFTPLDEHERLLQALLKERQLRQRIEQLKEFKRKGFSNLAQVEAQLAGKHKKEDKSRCEEVPNPCTTQSTARRVRKDPANQSS